MRVKVLILWSLFGISSTLLISCAPSIDRFRKVIKADDIQIPTDFGKKDGTMLVIIKGKRNFDRYIEKNFEENYTGKYVFILEGEERDPDYKDVGKYPYIFGQDVSVQFFKNTGTKNFGVYKYGAMFLIDRQTKKLYQTKERNAAWSRLMRAYIQELEATRLENLSKN